MKIIKLTEVKEGNIIAFEYVLHGRESFKVDSIEPMKTKEGYFIKCSSRICKSNDKRVRMTEKKIYLLHEKDPLL